MLDAIIFFSIKSNDLFLFLSLFVVVIREESLFAMKEKGKRRMNKLIKTTKS